MSAFNNSTLDSGVFNNEFLNKLKLKIKVDEIQSAMYGKACFRTAKVVSLGF